ncbi:hypothetical protein GCM10009823_05660 [Brevibacterium salitolerans]|uniref:Flavoprotein involved in K+ transport n=2 Tax=Brevibacteriaceae TaxID=85019 RepID=A0ABN2WE04_9MICO
MMLELTRVPATSVERLARRFEVSARTVQRDLAALRELGVPLWTRTGPAGGVGVVDGWRSPVLGMTGPEVQALLLGEAGARDLGLGEAHLTAQLKFGAAAPGGDPSVRERFLLDSEGWFSSVERPAALLEVAEAVRTGRRVRLRYARYGGDPAEGAPRLLDPLGLVRKAGAWYLVAAGTGRVRTYRVSRMSDVVVCEDGAARPPGFSLAEYWQRASAEFEASVLVCDVHLRIPEGSVAALLATVPGPATAQAVDAAVREDGCLSLRLRMEREDIAAGQLLAVPGAEVRSPASLRRALHARARAIAAANVPPAASGRARATTVQPLREETVSCVMDGRRGHEGVDMTETVTAHTQDTQTHAPGPDERVETWLSALDEALTAGDADAAAELFEEDGYWRDFVAFTWNLRTLEGREEIRQMLRAQLAHVAPSGWRLDEPATEADGVTEAWIRFETGVSRGWGHLRLREGRAWTLLTTMQELKGFEEKKGSAREKGVDHVIERGRKTWLERKQEHQARFGYEEQPYVVIVGGGQGGIGLAARLKRQGVPALVVERNERAGDSWRNRYKSLHLHDPVWYDHLPYLPFPDDWPVFAAKDRIGDWLEHYTALMELDYWSGTECLGAEFDEAAGTWRVRVDRRGEAVELRPTHLVFALGVSGYPNIPEFEGAESFEGEQTHSSAFTGEGEYEGRRAVVIGSNNSAHDICAALWEKGAEVTMVQRSSTHISRSESLMSLALGPLYSEEALANGITTEKADMLFASWPYRLLPGVQIPVYEQMAEQDAEFYRQLEEAGFELDMGEDGSGLFLKYLRRGSGYYIDVGASQLVIDGRIALARGQVTRIEPDAVVVDDGSAEGRRLPADLIVYATGYGSMNQWLRDLVSPEIADRVGKVWGFGSDTAKDPGPWEGELRNMWKPTAVDQLWIHGGNLHQSRHYSRYLALQLKARLEGLDTPVYGQQEVHHTS